MSSFVDANVLVYAIDPRDPEKRDTATDLLARLIHTGDLVISPQCLNETYRVVTDKRSILSREKARSYVETFLAFCRAPLDRTTTQLAWRLQDEMGFSWWDTLMLSSAIQAECADFYSEDMSDGATLGRLTIRNPFARSRSIGH